MRASTARQAPRVGTAAFTPVPLGSDPPGALLAALNADGDLLGLPVGSAHGEIDLADAPRGTRAVASKIVEGWEWRLTSGEGWALRQGKGPTRGDGTRPRLTILEPCRSVALRAVGVDEAFPDALVHVVIVWVQITRTGKWSADDGWAWSSEPAIGAGSGRPFGRQWARPPRQFAAIGGPASLLTVAPSVRALDVLCTPSDVERAEQAR
jgi:hypothetical protein